MRAKIFVVDGIIKEIKYINEFSFLISDNKITKFENGFLFPSFKDCHGHIVSLGKTLNGLTLNGLESPGECISKALTHLQRRGNWLTGSGWNHELWKVKEFPNKKMLDEAFPDIPVYLTRIDYHAAWVNSKALQLAGINSFTQNPNGGEILKDKSGEPSGILLDNAMSLAAKLIPEYSEEQYREFILSALYELAKSGFTEVHDMDLKPKHLRIFQNLDSENLLPISIYGYINPQNEDFDYSLFDYKGNNLILCGIKLYADGALGSRGAALLEPYSDDPNNSGILTITENELYKYSKTALEKGLHVATHAIGDRANRLTLQTYKKLYDDGIADSDSILRLEHAQIIHPDDMEIFSKYKIIASVQPIHCTSDAPMARKRLGERCEYAYPWRSLLQSGAILIAGSDFPIEPHNPFLGLEAFTLRTSANEQEIWYEEEIIDKWQAFNAFSYPANKLFNKEVNNYNFKVGDNANFIILKEDFDEVVRFDLKNIKIQAVIKNGKTIFEEKEENEKINILTFDIDQDIPVFNHKEIYNLYKFGFEIDKQILQNILELPRETLIQDLRLVLKDSIVRYEHFQKICDETDWDYKTTTFPLHALCLLIELKDANCLDNILEIINQSEELSYFWYGDLIDGIFGELLYSYALIDLQILFDIIVNPNTYYLFNLSAITTADKIYEHNPEKSNEIINLYKKIITYFINDVEDYSKNIIDIISFLVWRIVDFGLSQFLPDIENLYNFGLINESIIGDFVYIRREIFKPVDKNNKDENYTGIFSRYDFYFENYLPSDDDKSNNDFDDDDFDDDDFDDDDFDDDDFDDSDEEKKLNFTEYIDKKYPNILGNPISVTIKNTELKIGRNDPCPCGSGKKYKKCCMRKEV